MGYFVYIGLRNRKKNVLMTISKILTVLAIFWFLFAEIFFERDKKLSYDAKRIIRFIGIAAYVVIFIGLMGMYN